MPLQSSRCSWHRGGMGSQVFGLVASAVLVFVAACGTSGAGSHADGAGGDVTVEPPHCAGVPTPCTLLADAECTTTMGCRDDSQCSGAVESCSLQLSSVDCAQLQGCAWSSAEGKCVGLSTPCFSFFSESTCGAEAGCTWQARCSGVAGDCANLPLSLCTSEPGCYVAGWPASEVSSGGAAASAGGSVTTDTGGSSGNGASGVGGVGGAPLGSGGTGGASTIGGACQVNSDCAAAADGNLCIGAPICVAGQCLVDPSTRVDCSSVPVAACRVSRCNPVDGKCEDSVSPDGTTCPAADFCSVGGSCVNGACVEVPRCLSCETCNPSRRTCDPNPGYCQIDGVCVADGAPSSSSQCLACASTSPTAWTSLTGDACSGADKCFSDFACNAAGSCVGNTPAPPPAPGPMSPVSGVRSGRAVAGSTVLRPHFQWSPSTDTCSLPTYELEVDDSCTNGDLDGCPFPSPEIDVKGLTTTTYQPQSDLAIAATRPVGRRYFWRVRACRGPSCSAWSPVRYVDVGRARHDFNGDGYTDLAVGSWTDQGIYIYYGSSSGLPTVPAAIPLFVTRGTTGDVNGDGFTDLIATDPVTNVLANLYVFYGSASGLASKPDETVSLSNYDTAVPVFGDADFDGDGYGDVVTSSTTDTELGSVFAGAEAGLPSARSYALANPVQGSSANLSRMRAGDFTADAVNDLAMTGGFTETVTIFAGASGAMRSTAIDTIAGLASNTGDHAALVTGSFGGDLRSDLVLAYSESKPQANGALFGFIATPSFFGTAPDSTWPNAAASDDFGSDATTGRFLAQADATPIAVGAPYAHGTGKVAVFSSVDPFTFAFELVPASGTDASFGEEVQSPGDVDGDGQDELVVSWPQHQGTGTVHVYAGPVTATSVARVLTSPSGDEGGDFGSTLY